MTDQALHVESVTAGYVQGMPIVKDISLNVEPCEIVCIVGPNGAGKSTLLKSIAGLLPIASGSIRLGESIVNGISPDALSRSGIAFVPQLDNIFRTMSIEQNLVLAARRCHSHRQAHRRANSRVNSRAHSRVHRRERVRAMVELFPVLAEKYKAKAGSLSGGQRQFLAVAMALIAQPDLLLLDEPSAGLSPIAAQEVLGMLRGIAQTGVAVLMVEQNVKAALKISDRAYVLADGRNQHEGRSQALLEDPVLRKIFLGEGRQGGPYAAKSV